jgi:predicted pyridoxine 5'-phosphate oxidase superfamily flavin-nucleotide-binding protein
MIESENDLRSLIGAPKPAALLKPADRLTPLSRQFIERSPFVCIATARPDGGLDVSPRGDPPGFVRILDDRTLLIPERPGNRGRGDAYGKRRRGTSAEAGHPRLGPRGLHPMPEGTDPLGLVEPGPAARALRASQLR